MIQEKTSFALLVDIQAVRWRHVTICSRLIQTNKALELQILQPCLG